MPQLFAAIIRHGDYNQLPDTPSAHQPFPLTAAGEAQARAAADNLRQWLTNKDLLLAPSIDTSPLLRAWQTASIIAERLASSPVPVESFDALAERGLGSAANLTIAQIERILSIDPRSAEPPRDWKADSRYRLPLPGAESLIEAGTRVARHMTQRMNELRPLCQGDCLKVFVGHGAAFRHAAFHLGLLTYEQIAQLSMVHCQPVYFELLTDGRWRHIDGQWKQRTKQTACLD